MENSSHLDKLVHRSFKVIRASCTIGHVEGSLALGLSGGENLKDVYFATARLPAGAFVVLRGAGNAAVQRPDGRHVGSQTGTEAFGVGIGAALAVEGHLELEEEYFVGAAEALVCDVRGTREAALCAAFFAGEDGEFFVGGDEDVLEGLGRSRSAIAVGVEVGEGVAPDSGRCQLDLLLYIVKGGV